MASDVTRDVIHSATIYIRTFAFDSVHVDSQQTTVCLMQWRQFFGHLCIDTKWSSIVSIVMPRHSGLSAICLYIYSKAHEQPIIELQSYYTDGTLSITLARLRIEPNTFYYRSVCQSSFWRNSKTESWSDNYLDAFIVLCCVGIVLCWCKRIDEADVRTL